MKTPENIRIALRTRWRRQWPFWLGGGGSWPQRFALGAPDEATARRDWSGFTSWVQAWKDAALGHLECATRRWPSLGLQGVPTHVRFESAMELAAALGASTCAQFEAADRRWRDRTRAWPAATDALRRTADWLGECSEQDFERFVAVVDWLVAHPTSGLRLRAIPVPGIHSKWIEKRTAPLGLVLAALRGQPPGMAFTELAGLTADPPRRRIRVLDPELRDKFGGLADISLGLPELARLVLPLTTVLIVENLQTALAFGDLDGVLLLFGAGFAVSDLRGVPWLGAVPLLYWGDIDGAGFAILNTLRSHFPHTRSILMDEFTLLHHRDQWSHDESASAGELPLLDAQERDLYRKLGSGAYGPAVRLEQERIDWAWACGRIADALGRGTCSDASS